MTETVCQVSLVAIHILHSSTPFVQIVSPQNKMTPVTIKQTNKQTNNNAELEALNCATLTNGFPHDGSFPVKYTVYVFSQGLFLHSFTLQILHCAINQMLIKC